MTSWPLWRHLTWIWQLDLIDRSCDLVLHADWSIWVTWPISGFLIGRARSGPLYYSKVSSTYHDFTTTNSSSISMLYKQKYPQHTMTLPPQPHRTYQSYTNKSILNIYDKLIEYINVTQTKLSSTYQDFTTANSVKTHRKSLELLVHWLVQVVIYIHIDILLSRSK